jgi:serine/threonine protein kinase
MPHANGTKIDRYVIERFIARGGMAEVYEASDSQLRRRVALKLIHAGGTAATVERLLGEARALASFSHPNTVAIHDVLQWRGEPCLVMELVRGRTLRDVLSSGSATTEQKVRYLLGIARGLDATHKAGFVHRDLKLENVMVCDDDSVKLLDFGIAKRLPSDEERPSSNHTIEGKVIGTPAYMAPEQLAGWTLDTRADQYSWGVVAVELLCGDHASPMTPSVAKKSLAGRAPTHVVDLVVRAVSRHPDDRHPSMAQVVAALEQQTPIASPPAASTDLEAPPRRGEALREPSSLARRVLPAPAAFVALLALGGAVAPLVLRRNAWTPATPGALAADATESGRTIITDPSGSDVAGASAGSSILSLSSSRTPSTKLGGNLGCLCRPLGGGQSLCRQMDVGIARCWCKDGKALCPFPQHWSDGAGDWVPDCRNRLQGFGRTVDAKDGDACAGYDGENKVDGHLESCQICATVESFAGTPGARCVGYDGTRKPVAGVVDCGNLERGCRGGDVTACDELERRR